MKKDMTADSASRQSYPLISKLLFIAGLVAALYTVGLMITLIRSADAAFPGANVRSRS